MSLQAVANNNIDRRRHSPRPQRRAAVRPVWVFLLWLGIAPWAAAEHVDTPSVTIGVLAFRGTEIAAEQWLPLANYLNDAIPNQRFSIVPLTLDDIKLRVAAKELDFVLTHAASYSSLEADYGASRIATVQWHRGDSHYAVFGAAIFARRDNADIKTLEDLQGRRFAAVHPDAFGGWWMAQKELLDHGIEQSDFEEMKFTGFPQDDVVYAVRDGAVDAGTVRSGVLEAMAAKGKIKLDDFQILNMQPQELYPFVHSTALYPEWAFAMLRNTHVDLARRVTVALLSAPMMKVTAVGGDTLTWTIPLDYSPVMKLMHQLQVGPYRDTVTSVADMLRRYWPWLLGGGVLFALVAAFAVYVTRLNRRLWRASDTAQTQTQRLRALYDVTSSRSPSIEKRLHAALTTAGKLLNADVGLIVSANPGQNYCTVRQVVGLDSTACSPGKRFPLAGCATSAILAESSAISLNRIAATLWESYPSSPCVGFESFIGSRLFVFNRPAGTIEFYSRQPRAEPYTPADEEIVTLIARWVSALLERERSQISDLARATAEEANRAKTQFLANMSHELRTPLHAIIGHVQLLSEENADPGVREEVAQIDAAAHGLLHAVDQLLELTKIESGKITLCYDTIELVPFISDTFEHAKRRCTHPDIHLRLQVDARVKELVVDSQRLRYILDSLLSNALKYTKRGNIDLIVETVIKEGQPFMRFVVSDTGIGIDTRQKQLLFQPFSQADGSSTRRYSGFGIGLAVSNGLARHMGGALNVRSTVGQGSAFELVLPRDPDIEHSTTA